ncbi:hypothetical protein P7L70_03995 (plasmid) [Tistrella mobilis]|uniref:hypothetical protein n=1 Tax=Tistrella mobilis TaxID=171437 RepID=UPI00355890EA
MTDPREADARNRARDPRDTRPSGEHPAPIAPAPGDLPPVRPDAPPTSAELRDRIDRGQTGDKVPVVDPAAAPLGTDDEAAGTPPKAADVAAAATAETVHHPVSAPGLDGDRLEPSPGGQPRQLPRGLYVVGVITIIFMGMIVAVELLVR